MKVIATTYAQESKYYKECLKNYYLNGIEYLRINCTRVSIDDYIEQMRNLFRNQLEVNGDKIKILLDLPLPGAKPRIKFKYPVPEDRVAVRNSGEIRHFRIDKGEHLYLVRHFDLLPYELQFEINDFSYLESVGINEIIYVSENSLEMKVIDKNTDFVELVAITSGYISYNKSIYTQKVSYVKSVDYQRYQPLIDYVKPELIALSFVENVSDIEEFKKNINIGEAKIMAKIESTKAVENINEIVERVDAIMIARGDLYVNCSFSNFPIYIEKILDICIGRKPVYIATGILSSMNTEDLSPSRAELTELYYYISKKVSGFILNFATSQEIIVLNKAIEIILDMFNAIEEKNIAQIVIN